MIADFISETVDALEEELTGFESTMLDRHSDSDWSNISMLRKRVASIRRYLAPQRQALEVLCRSGKILSDDLNFELRDISDRMLRYIEDLDMIKERCLLLQEEIRNHIADQQGKRMYVLSLVTAIFLPLSFLTGIFGMNVAGLPGLENPMAFEYLVDFMLGIAIVAVAFMKWNKWM
jgi:zinc transporter